MKQKISSFIEEEQDDEYPRFQLSMRSRIITVQVLLLGFILVSTNIGMIRDNQYNQIDALLGFTAIDLAVIGLLLIGIALAIQTDRNTKRTGIIVLLLVAILTATALLNYLWIKTDSGSFQLEATLRPELIITELDSENNLTLIIESRGYKGNLTIKEELSITGQDHRLTGPKTINLPLPPGQEEIEYSVTFLGDSSPGALNFSLVLNLKGQSANDNFTIKTNAVSVELQPDPEPENMVPSWSLDMSDGGLVYASGSPSVADIDGDGQKEIIIGYRKACQGSREIGGENRLLCATASGDVKWVFPSLDKPGLPLQVEFTARPLVISDPTLIDLNGDGFLEVLIGTRGGAVHCLNSDGEEIWNFSKSEALGNVSLEYFDEFDESLTIRFSGTLGSAETPQVYDDDKDGEYEIYVSSGPPEKEWLIEWGRITSLDSSGKLLWNVEVEGVPSQPLVWDIDQDGEGEIVASLSNNYVICLKARNGEEKWRHYIPGHEWYLQSIPIAADVDKDDRYELIIGSNDGNLYILDENGEEEWSFKTPLSAGKLQYSFPIGDIDKDTNLETCFIDDKYVYCVDLYSKQQEWRFAPSNPDDSNNYNLFADVTGDGEIDVLVVSPSLYVLSNKGELQAVFNTTRISHDYWAQSGPWIGDLDGDGKIEILVKLAGDGLYCLETDAVMDPSLIPWPKIVSNTLNRPVIPIKK